MARPYSTDLRDRVVASVTGGRTVPGDGGDIWGECGERGEVVAAFPEKACADVLYASGLRDLATMHMVVQAVGKPLNVVMSAADPVLTAAEMEAVGVKRLSVGGALSRLALAAVIKGARKMKEQGGFTWVRVTMPTNDLKHLFCA